MQAHSISTLQLAFFRKKTWIVSLSAKADAQLISATIDVNTAHLAI